MTTTTGPKKPTEQSTAQEVISLIYQRLREQPPPDTFTVEELVQWIPQIDLNEFLVLIKDFNDSICDDTKESDDWHFAKKVYSRLIQCGKALFEWDNEVLKYVNFYAVPTPLITPDISDDLRLAAQFAQCLQFHFPNLLIPGTMLEGHRYWELMLNVTEIAGKPPALPLANHLGKAREKTLEERPTATETVAKSIEAINQLWVFAYQHNDKLKHPITPLVEAFITAPPVKQVTKEYDRMHPTAVVTTRLGSVKDINFVDAEGARLREFATPESITQVDTSQTLLGFAQEPPDSILPDVMPLDVALPDGVELSTRKGAVSHVVRVFFEALMALAPRETKADISFTLGDLIDYLYPDGKFNRTNQLPYIINALDVLHFYATVPFKQPVTGSIGKWRPVVVRNALAPNSKNDDRIFLDVRLPDDAKQGMLVEKHIMRILGKASAPQFSAYLSSCGIWNKYGTVKGQLIDPTRPVINRNSEGYLVDDNGNELIGSHGKRIKNPYRSDAIAQGKREDNPARDAYPILSNSDLIKACYPSSQMQSVSKPKALKRAKEYWTQLEEAGYVKIERFSEGWRIMPPDSHMKKYRATTEASRQSRRG